MKYLVEEYFRGVQMDTVASFKHLSHARTFVKAIQEQDDGCEYEILYLDENSV